MKDKFEITHNKLINFIMSNVRYKEDRHFIRKQIDINNIKLRNVYFRATSISSRDHRTPVYKALWNKESVSDVVKSDGKLALYRNKQSFEIVENKGVGKQIMFTFI